MLFYPDIGVTRGQALYDTPPPGSDAEELPRSSCSRTRTERAKSGFDAATAASKQRSSRSKRTRARNKDNTAPNKKARISAQNAPRSEHEQLAPEATDTEPEMAVGDRVTSKSPTPIEISDEPEGQPRREELQAKLARKFQNVLDTSGTQTLMEVDAATSIDPAYTSQPPEHDIETRILSPTQVGVGGGFHLDHPTHRPGNGKTYQLKRSHNLMPSSRLADRSFTSSDGVSDTNINNLRIPLRLSQPPASNQPPQLLCDRTSPFYTTTSALNPTLRAPNEPDTSLPFGVPTDSQSLGDPIPTRPPSQNVPHSSQEDRDMRIRARSMARTVGRSSTLPTTPVRAAPTQKTAATSTRNLIGKIYGTRLNIIEINSQRPPTTKRNWQSRRNWSTPSTQHRTNPTPMPSTEPTPQQQPRRKSRHQPPPLEISDLDEEPDLLEGFDADDHVAKSAAEGIMVKTRSSKPTVHDLHGVERAIWKEVRNITWGFSMGQGNFQTRGVFAVWLETVHSQVFKHKYPGHTFRCMSDNMSKVILNSLSNCRYQDLLRVRELVKDFYRLKNPSSEVEQAENQSIIEDVYPRSFHCDPMKEESPYESEVMARGLVDIFFYGPAAIGAIYPGLFERTIEPRDERKHLAVLAYIATMIQFGLGEWQGGFFMKKSLNANNMLNIFICHYEGLKIVAHKAHDRLISLYNKWFNDALSSSRAQLVFKKKSFVQPIIRPETVRPDTPCRSPTPNITTRSELAVHTPSHTPAPSRHNSPLELHPAPLVDTGPSCPNAHQLIPRRSPSPRPPTPEVPRVVTFGTPPLDQIQLQLSPHHDPTPTPERDMEGNLTAWAKGKGRMADQGDSAYVQ